MRNVGKAANLFARDYFTGGSRNTGTRPLITLYSIGSGTDCYWINSQGDVNCGGVICYLGMIYMRAPINAAASMSADTAPVGTESVGTLSSLIATWDCADGGGLRMDDNGSVTYHMPGGSGGGGGGGGGGGDCSDPTPGDTNDNGSPVQDEIRNLQHTCEVSLPVPDGWTDEEIFGLTKGEMTLLWSDPLKWIGRKTQMYAVRDSAYVLSMDATGTVYRVDDTKQNAFQHAIWSALMTRAFGYSDALAWTNAHEELGKTLTNAELEQKAMDLHNNAIGLNNANVLADAYADVWAARTQLCWLTGVDASVSCGG